MGLVAREVVSQTMVRPNFRFNFQKYFLRLGWLGGGTPGTMAIPAALTARELASLRPDSSQIITHRRKTRSHLFSFLFKRFAGPLQRMARHASLSVMRRFFSSFCWVLKDTTRGYLIKRNQQFIWNSINISMIPTTPTRLASGSWLRKSDEFKCHARKNASMSTPTS